jgi:hypothetical protein
VVPEARGRAAQITQGAEAYREQTVAEAKGQTARFLKVYEEYKKAPDVTRQRIYLETAVRDDNSFTPLIRWRDIAVEGMKNLYHRAPRPGFNLPRLQGYRPEIAFYDALGM